MRLACRMMGVHPSTDYRWRRQVLAYGLEVLRPRERRRPRMPNATPPFVEQRVVAFALGHPGFGPDRIAAELARPKWGGIRLSPNGVWRVLRRHGLNTRRRRLGLIAGYAATPRTAASTRGAGTASGRVAAGGAGLDGLLLRRASAGHQGRGVAIHRHRCRLGLLLGRATRRISQALRVALDLGAGSARRGRSRRSGLDLRGGHDRSRHRVRRRVHGHPRPSSESNTAASSPVDPRPTAASNGCNKPSSKSAGNRRSLDTYCPTSPVCAKNSAATSATTTPTEPTPADGTRDEHPNKSSERPRCGRANRRRASPSPPLGEATI